MAFDSLVLISALALFGAAIAAWRLSAALTVQARLYLRFAAVLFAALASASIFSLSDIAALLLLPLAAGALALSALARFARPLGSIGATLTLVACLAAGLCAMLLNLWIAALLPVAICGLTIVAAALQAMAMVPILAGFALFASALACLQPGADAGTLLFAAAALLGLARNTRTRDQLVRSISSERRGAAVP